MMDCIFEPQNFRSEIVWKRATAHSDATTKIRYWEPYYTFLRNVIKYKI